MRTIRFALAVLLAAGCGGSNGSPSPGPTRFVVAVTVSGPGLVHGLGTDCRGACTQRFDNGASVTLVAVPDDGATFSGWSGSCSGTANCALTVASDLSVNAIFAGGNPPPPDGGPPPEQHRLTVSVTGQGTVQSTPAGIACPGNCSATFPAGTQVILAATGDGFAGWSGSCSDTGPTCTVTMDADKLVGATFTRPPSTWTLSVQVTGSGTVTSAPPGISCPGSCGATYANGTVVTLSETPASGWTFDGWGDGCSGPGGCTVTMDADKTVYATFHEASHPPVFTLAVTGNGHVAVSLNPPDGVMRICWGPATCNWQIPPGAMISLSASPDPGWDLLDWGGGCDPVVGYFCQGPMPNYDQGVTVTFAQKRMFTVNISGGNGRVVSDPPGINCPGSCAGYFLAGSTIHLTATPMPPSTIVIWDPNGGCGPFGHSYVCTGPVPDYDYAVAVTFVP